MSRTRRHGTDRVQFTVLYFKEVIIANKCINLYKKNPAPSFLKLQS